MNWKCLCFLIIILCSSIIVAQDEARLLRFPTIHGDNVVFTYAGDLYTVAKQGGIARKLTNDIGYEMFAHFSPDGSKIAFTGQYDGNTEVYVMPAQGGVPQRLTYSATLGRDEVSDRMGPNNIVMGWKDNEHIIYRSRTASWDAFVGQLNLVSIHGDLPEQIPFSTGSWCSYSPDKKSIAYNRVFREFRTWKRYRGGQADDIRIYNFETKETTQITNDPAQDIFPMWHGKYIYFVSDRTKRMNLYRYDTETKETAQLTNFTEFDIKFPSLGDNAVIFENGGYIYYYDFATEQTIKVSVQLAEDLNNRREALISVSNRIESASIGPDGKRAVFCARGNIFTVPEKNGATRNITNQNGVHNRNAVWSPDGQWIAYISDETGEDEIYIRKDSQGKGEVIALTNQGGYYKYRLVWSPDSKKILWADRAQDLKYVDIDTKEITLVRHCKVFEIPEYSWAPDSNWIIYSEYTSLKSPCSIIKVYSLETKETHEITDKWYYSSSATFSPDGKYIYFASARHFHPTYGWTEWDHVYVDMYKIYLVTLNKDTASPLTPQSDEVEVTKKEAAQDEMPKEENKEKASKEDKFAVTIDFDGLASRIVEFPIPNGNYGAIEATKDKLYYIGMKDDTVSLHVFDFKSQKSTEVGNFQGYTISANQQKMMVKQQNQYAIVDLPAGRLDISKTLDLSNMKMRLNRTKEWTQIFHESWRQMRDFIYAPNMHGVDWPKMRDTYAQLIPYVSNRRDLTYIIGEMISELNLGHTYIGGGDFPQAPRIKMGLLGAKLQRDPESQYYKIVKIFQGQNWNKSLRSPLTEIGVNAKEGDYILAVNGQSVKDMNNIYESLIDTADKETILTINNQASEEGSRDVTIKPLADVQELVYFNWVENNIAKVDKATNGKVGYVHIPDMMYTGLNEFAKYFYPQLNKPGLIIDVRHNGGGHVSPMIAARLAKKLVFFVITRNGQPDVNPDETHYGSKVALIDQYSASDGDIFAYRFRKLGLGKLIGTRTWGGVVGIRGSLPFVDGGSLHKPEFSRYDEQGNWIMEGVGVEPDIEVENDPALEFQDIDRQLERAIEEVLRDIEANPKTITPIPPYPIKN
ncbi:MAG: PD40 domain-containing protein [Planctomycetes bacterium]|jgi:tricorn protease|nr:PD40 domain-containing protein [Planctomycetota bacterium]HPY76023.1 S41 family peptidase [Planctomycetota bacterium]HQB01560.1 S41 family peptidase [Planctomycetota bacterium]